MQNAAGSVHDTGIDVPGQSHHQATDKGTQRHAQKQIAHGAGCPAYRDHQQDPRSITKVGIEQKHKADG